MEQEGIHVSGFGILADDLTGAMDTGSQFAQAGFQTRVHLSPQPTDDEVAVLDTESRGDPPDVAYEKVFRAAQALGGRRVYKKVDSTLRGNVGQELDAAMDALGFQRALICPAFPAAGRTVVQGILRVQGIPLRQTDFAGDPLCPSTDHIPSLLEQQSRRAVGHAPLEAVRGGVAGLAAAILARTEPLVVLDAEEDADLLAIAQAARSLGEGCLTCGSAGLAWALPGGFLLVPLGSPVRRPRQGGLPVLVVAGSRRTATLRQIEALLSASEGGLVEVDPAGPQEAVAQAIEMAVRRLDEGQNVVVTTAFRPYFPESGQAVAERLGDVAAQVARARCLSGLVLTGGDIAFAACRALGVVALEIEGEVAPGLPTGVIVGGAKSGTRLVTKAGGFGREDALRKAIAYLRGEE
ncbi:MAG: four-carbon acid sugar kinase family protein [Anaerolineae bacterium]